MLLKAKGVNGQIQFDGQKIIISRKGILSLLTQGVKGEKVIFLSSISSVQFKKAGAVFNGYIQFTFNGGAEAKGGIFQATQDENSIMYTAKHSEDFECLKNEIEKSLLNPANNSSNAFSEADKIKKLAEMHKDGILTFEEFNEQKTKILSRI